MDGDRSAMEQAARAATIAVEALDLQLPVETRLVPGLERGLQVGVRGARLLTELPWVRSLGRLSLEVSTDGWRFPTPPAEPLPPARCAPKARPPNRPSLTPDKHRDFETKDRLTHLRPPKDTVLLKDRLLYLLQPSLESCLTGKQLRLPLRPYPYQLEGIAFLMPRHAALLADEMGLGKTGQAILALRLLFQAGLIRRGLIVCPKPLISHW